MTATTTGLAELPADYPERVYAGILGKAIGVYLGRPVEGWPNDLIETVVGEVDRYVNEEVSARLQDLGIILRPGEELPLVVTDDDISGPLTFVRSLEDNGYDPGITAKAIGRSWLNYLVEAKTVLWWGGMGNSTEHTAYLRLREGHDAPHSGSMALNGPVVAQQIGGELFVDGWAMLHPGDPERAAELAGRAASVSHDGAGLHGGQIIAALEAQAFLETPSRAAVDRMLDIAVGLIPADAMLRRVIDDVREWHAANPDDWRATFGRIREHYNQDDWGGTCHMVPNHALVIMSLLHSDGDYRRGQTIINTAGWDTDSNAGSLGCIQGILGGVTGLESDGPDLRGPVADRIYLASADGGRAITNAGTEADHLLRLAYRMRGLAEPTPKAGARFHFVYPGSVQGFMSDDLEVRNRRAPDGSRWLVLDSETGRGTARVATFMDSLRAAEFFDHDFFYNLLASPSLASGQEVRARVVNLGDAPADVALGVEAWTAADELDTLPGESVPIPAGNDAVLTMQVPDTDGRPVASVGLELHGDPGARLALDWLTWGGVPTVSLGVHAGGSMWRRGWVDGTQVPQEFWYAESFRLIQNSGTGLRIHGMPGMG